MVGRAFLENGFKATFWLSCVKDSTCMAYIHTVLCVSRLQESEGSPGEWLRSHISTCMPWASMGRTLEGTIVAPWCHKILPFVYAALLTTQSPWGSTLEGNYTPSMNILRGKNLSKKNAWTIQVNSALQNHFNDPLSLFGCPQFEGNRLTIALQKLLVTSTISLNMMGMIEGSWHETTNVLCVLIQTCISRVMHVSSSLTPSLFF